MAQFIAYPKALSYLADRIGATQEEIAAWIFLGPESGGLTAYLNANELKPPPRFHYNHGNEGDFDYLSPLMACWFLEKDIANFQPEDRYITGKALIERWSKQPGIQPQAFIGAKIAEGRLFDMHPIFGCTRVSGSGDNSFPLIESGLFTVSSVEAIEAEDFGGMASKQGETHPMITREYPPSMLINFDEFLFYLTIDSFYGMKSTNSKQIIEGVYASKKGNALYEQFRNRFSRQPFKGDKQRELLYLWCGFMGLPIYQNGSATSWRHGDFTTHWLEEIQLELNEIQDFLLTHSMPLPIKLFSNNHNSIGITPTEQTIPEKTNHPLAIFRTMKDLRFEEITIRIDPENFALRISARGKNASVPFSTIGITKKYEMVLNRHGEVFMAMANGQAGNGSKRQRVRPALLH
ncbi:MAG: hypothetical protein JMN27_16305 [gamma proteobacterium endosymbiont of Lamellibrachia anaximandri]|nr:hypothetical protein [gamma proteobacterium endosymbiont of Lamellibrachia anaximandri]MBL3535370.1 hypothetical protein [gamma proteobacterium endosymbiont of Lamellibrachia anaximandri]